MKTLLFILASTLAFGQTALINGSSAKFRNVTGTAAPSSGTCDASSEVGSFYVRTGDQASVPTQVYVCKKTGASTYAWGPFFGYTQTAAPATCATGELWFDTDATAGSNLNLCTASNTWTAISGGGGSGTVSVVSSGSLASTALVTGGGTTTLQTPSSSATLDSSGNLVVNSISTGSSAPLCVNGTAGLLCLKEGTAGTGEASAALLYTKTDHLLYANLNNGGEVQVPTATSTATLTNKTFDTAGTGNSFKINGTAITAVSGTGAVCLASGSSCGGGGGGTRTITLPVGGGSFSGAQGLAFSTDGTGVSATTLSSLRIVAASLTNSGTPYLVSPIWLPADYSSGLTVSLMMVDSSGAGGHVRFAYGLECQTSAAAFSTSFTNTATSADTTLTSFGNQQLIAATSLATSGCSAGQAATFKVERDNTVGSNMAGNAQIYAIKLSYTSSY